MVAHMVFTPIFFFEISGSGAILSMPAVEGALIVKLGSSAAAGPFDSRRSGFIGLFCDDEGPELVVPTDGPFQLLDLMLCLLLFKHSVSVLVLHRCLDLDKLHLLLEIFLLRLPVSPFVLNLPVPLLILDLPVSLLNLDLPVSLLVLHRYLDLN